MLTGSSLMPPSCAASPTTQVGAGPDHAQTTMPRCSLSLNVAVLRWTTVSRIIAASEDA